MAKKTNELDGKVKIRILPGRGIGGVGYAGDVTWMDEAEAKQYATDGYLEILKNEEDSSLRTNPVIPATDPTITAEDAEIIEKIKAVTSIAELYKFQVDGRSKVVEDAINAKGIELHEAEFIAEINAATKMKDLEKFKKIEGYSETVANALNAKVHELRGDKKEKDHAIMPPEVKRQ